MKKLIVAAVLALGACNVSFAQSEQKMNNEHMKMSAEDRAKMQTDRMDKMLSLTADQHASISVINLSAAKEIEAMRQQGGGRDKMKVVMEKKDEQIMKVLSSDQAAKYKQFQEERRAKMMERREGGESGS